MPWISEELCEGCGACVAECPVGAIHLAGSGTAVLDEAACIRCGRCHDVCPYDAVRHDGERIPQEVAANLQWVRGLLGHFGEPSERTAFMDRMVRFFNKQKKVCERTLAAIEAAAADPAEGIDAAIEALSQPQQGQTAPKR
jgi:ferredoxin